MTYQKYLWKTIQIRESSIHAPKNLSTFVVLSPSQLFPQIPFIIKILQKLKMLYYVIISTTSQSYYLGDSFLNSKV
jgi:hypothetical protein